MNAIRRSTERGIAAVTGAGPLGADQVAVLVEAQRGGGHAAAPGHLADGRAASAIRTGKHESALTSSSLELVAWRDIKLEEATMSERGQRASRSPTRSPRGRGVEAGYGRRGEFALPGRTAARSATCTATTPAHFSFGKEVGAALREQGRVVDHPVFAGKDAMAARRTTMMSVRDVIELTLNRSHVGRLLGYAAESDRIGRCGPRAVRSAPGAILASAVWTDAECDAEDSEASLVIGRSHRARAQRRPLTLPLGPHRATTRTSSPQSTSAPPQPYAERPATARIERRSSRAWPR